MNFPSDLPWMIEYKVGKTVRCTLPHREVQFVSSSGCTDAAVICPEIPLGATGWRRPGETDWKPLESLPSEWTPFLNRPRPSAMDPRKSH